MEDFVWLFLTVLVALVAFAVVAAGRHGRVRSLEQNPKRCSNCETPVSLRRVPFLRSHMLRREWVCPHCGTRMNRRGSVAGAAS